MQTVSTVELAGPDELSLAYTPGVALVCEAIAADPTMTQHYTWVPNVVAVVSDGTAVLGLGDIGPAAAMPVMEGKAVLFKQFGGVDAVPICLDTTDTEEIIETVVRLAPSFGGINLEDISAPRCFEIEDRLKDLLDIPVFHDDQHGTAVVALAALRTRSAHRTLAGDDPGGHLRCRRRRRRGGEDPPGAGITDLAVTDRKGVLHSSREDLTPVKRALAEMTRRQDRSPGLAADVLDGADAYLGLSGGTIPEEDVARMAARRDHLRRWPTRRPRCTPTSRASTPGSWPPDARTSRTRSTTCWPSPGSSAGAFDVNATGDHRGHEAGRGRARWPSSSATT